MFYRTRVRVLIGAKVITSLRSHAPCLSGFFPCVVIRLADTFRARSHFCESYCEFLSDSMGQFICQIRIHNSCSREAFFSARVGIMTRQLSVCPFSQEEIAGSFGLATKNEEDKISSIPSSSLLLQGDWTGCRTGSGEKLSRSQATQGQAIR